MVKHLLMIAAALVLASCSASRPNMIPRGRIATVTLNERTEHTGELIALQDSVLVMISDRYRIIDARSISSVQLHMDQDRGWLLMVAGFQFLPSILLATGNPFPLLSHTSYCDECVTPGIIGLGVTGLTAALYLSSEPQTLYTWPLTSEETDALRLHTRFPYGITAEQMKQLGSVVAPGQ